MQIRDAVLATLREQVGSVSTMPGFRSSYRVNGKRVNVRTATQKKGDQYWFDVTPAFYEERQMDFFLYACGSASQAYIIPRQEFERLIEGASLGGQKQVPNFTIYCDKHVFEPAGGRSRRRSLMSFFNKYELLK